MAKQALPIPIPDKSSLDAARDQINLAQARIDSFKTRASTLKENLEALKCEQAKVRKSITESIAAGEEDQNKLIDQQRNIEDEIYKVDRLLESYDSVALVKDEYSNLSRKVRDFETARKDYWKEIYDSAQ